MYFEQFYLGCLAHASYLLASGGEAVVIDPQRDVDIYLQAAARQNVAIRHVFETHLHADFVSGHKELTERTGAKIYIGPNGRATIPHVEVRDGFELSVGSFCVRVLETPGHTPESICLLVTDKEKSADPWALFTGDTLFVGDVGRPDLSSIYTPEVLAGMLYDSLHRKLLTLPDSVMIYPAHGAGSLCGRNLGSARFSSIRTERLTNYALQIKTREQFIRELTTNLPPRPEYFPLDAQINRTGAPSLSHLSEIPPIAPRRLQSLIAEGAIAMDVRSGNEFAAGHVPGSINISLAGQFASWAGALLGLASRPILLGDTPVQLAEARLHLARVGIDEVGGYLKGGVEAWRQEGLAVEVLEEISVMALHEVLHRQSSKLIDVRRQSEWQKGHIEIASLWPLDQFRTALPDIDREDPVAVMCQGGYRSGIASSLLVRAGFQTVANVVGGFEAWRTAGLPVVREGAVAAEGL